MFAFFMMFTNAYHCVAIKDVSEMSESLAYAGIVKVMLVQEIMFLIKAKGVRQIIDVVEKDFIEMYQATDSQRYLTEVDIKHMYYAYECIIYIRYF